MQEGVGCLGEFLDKRNDDWNLEIPVKWYKRLNIV